MRAALRSAARIIKMLLTLGYGLLLAVTVWPTGLLLAGAETLEGRACGAVAAVTLTLFGALLVGASRRVTVPLGVAAVLLVAWLVHRAPDGIPQPGSRLASQFYPPASYPRFSPFNILPEIDQIRLGAILAPQVAARMGPETTQRVLSVTMPIYREMRSDPEMGALGSVMHLAFTNARGAHHWQYIPRHRPGDKLPLLVFYHGSAGNFASYLWFWRQAADRLRVAVVLPTMGAGHVSSDRIRMPRDADFDLNRVWVAGLSNGSEQAMVTACHLGAACRGVILVSPMRITPYAVRHMLPVLVVHGFTAQVTTSSTSRTSPTSPRPGSASRWTARA
jgi:hypothetical protein